MKKNRKVTGKFVDTFLCVFFVTSMSAQAIILKEPLIFTNFFMGATFGMIAQRIRRGKD